MDTFACKACSCTFIHLLSAVGHPQAQLPFLSFPCSLLSGPFLTLTTTPFYPCLLLVLHAVIHTFIVWLCRVCDGRLCQITWKSKGALQCMNVARLWWPSSSGKSLGAWSKWSGSPLFLGAGQLLTLGRWGGIRIKFQGWVKGWGSERGSFKLL